jgi:peptidyl-prolyl cis-trans isomerase SurA
VYNLVSSKKLDFYTAASLYSDDKETKYNGGMILNAQNVQTRTTYIPVDQLDAGIFTAIDTLEVGEYSKPSRFTGPDGKNAYRFVYLKSRTAPHQANLQQDFAKIKDAALEDKMDRVVSDWFDTKRKSSYIRIDQEYQSCDILKVWVD